MKKFIVASLAVFSISAFADDFSKLKEHQLKSFDKDIQNSTWAKKCVSDSKNPEDINKCFAELTSRNKAKRTEDEAFFKSLSSQVPPTAPAKNP